MEHKNNTLSNEMMNKIIEIAHQPINEQEDSPCSCGVNEACNMCREEPEEASPLTGFREVLDKPHTNCMCGPEESCTFCKDEKIAAGKGAKFDGGKLRYSLVPPIAMESLADVLTFGAKKYAANSWQNVQNAEERYLDALYRHLEAYRAGESVDSDSGKSHLAHAITNVAFLLHFEAEAK